MKYAVVIWLFGLSALALVALMPPVTAAVVTLVLGVIACVAILTFDNDINLKREKHRDQQGRIEALRLYVQQQAALEMAHERAQRAASLHVVLTDTDEIDVGDEPLAYPSLGRALPFETPEAPPSASNNTPHILRATRNDDDWEV
jgi:hypothetical protein